MAFQISIIEITENSRVASLHEELDESLEAFNQLINQRDWQPEDAAVSLTYITNNKRMAQYALQDFNYGQSGQG